MPIDTFVAGDPADILRVGDRLRRTVAVALEAAADDAAAARRSADDGWDGEASDRYLREASRLVVRIDTVHREILEVAVVFDRISAALSSVLDDMAAIRRRASAAGLMVVCDVIGDPPPGSDPSVIRAYDECAAAAEDVHARWAREVAAVTHRWTSKAWAATFTITTGLDTPAAKIAAGVKDLRTKAALLERHSITSMQALLDLPPGTPYEEVRHLFVQARESVGGLADATTRHAEVKNLPKIIGIGAGAFGLVAGTGLDYYAGGESFEQAVVSNSTGIAASIVAGALAGAAVPFIGPVGGALIGTTVGIMTSGGVDHLYENSSTTAWSTVNASIGEAEDALHALKDLGGAVLGGLVDAQ